MITSGAALCGFNLGCRRSSSGFDGLPKSRAPDRLWAVNLSADLSWDEKNVLTCLQGLLNRVKARVYFIHGGPDQFWLEYYRDEFGISYDILDQPGQLFEMFAGEIGGYVLYDPDRPHSLNLATILGALQDAVPVSRTWERRAWDYGLEKIDVVPEKLSDLHQAYEWALAELFPRCRQDMLAQLCVHHPHWPTSTFANRDYVMAHTIFSVDISSSERDKKDYQLLQRIYRAIEPGAIVIGWHCVRDKEHEAIALSSRFGHYGMCTLHTPNLSVHASIPLASEADLRQRPLKEIPLERKIYIAFMTTDGDATWFMRNLVDTDWANPAHGTFKYNWGFLPMAYDLMPGIVQFYMRNAKAGDYFVAGPSGATYTYPHLHADPEKFLRLTHLYMRKCGLRTVHMTNWNDRDWWQEAECPGFVDLLRVHLPDCAGYVRGMGESAFEKHYIGGGRPYIFCGEGIHTWSEIRRTLDDFISACSNRPLFIYCLVNHTIPMDRIKKAVDELDRTDLEPVHLDELLQLIEQAARRGMITGDLYPDKSKLRDILAAEAAQAWPGFLAELEQFHGQFENGEQGYIEHIKQTPIGLEAIVPADFLAFAAIWHAMKLVKLSLEVRGIYVNHKPTAGKKFIREYAGTADIAVVEELQDLWNRWHRETVTFSRAVELAERLIALAGMVSVQV